MEQVKDHVCKAFAVKRGKDAELQRIGGMKKEFLPEAFFGRRVRSRHP